jgi:transposase-like protein
MPARKGQPSGTCTICAHLERVRAELLLAGGASIHSVARKFGVSYHALRRHWIAHVDEARRTNLRLGPVSRQALASRVSEESQSVLDHLNVAKAAIYQMLDAALNAGDRVGVAMLVGRLHENLREVARLTGLLAQSPLIQHNTINNNLYTSPEFTRLRTGLLQLGRDHPQIRPDLIAMLKRLDAEPAAILAEPPRLIEHEGSADE